MLLGQLQNRWKKHFKDEVLLHGQVVKAILTDILANRKLFPIIHYLVHHNKFGKTLSSHFYTQSVECSG